MNGDKSMNTIPAPEMKTTLSEQELKIIGLKSGIEIHQQLEGKKLFCNCPTIIRDDTPDFEIKRFLRASAGESGKIDKAALAEIKKLKYYIYEGYEDTTCLVEVDEEPPGPVNKDALEATLQMSTFLKMQPVDQLRFMRKTVVNGSNTSGFQRTGLVAMNGCLETKDGHLVGIESLCLEEDACKDVASTETYTRYNLSRLGIPLIEIATAPDLKTPTMIAEVAAQIGMLLRSLPSVKRGLGTIRQDVNISIAEGVRVEIKGAQDLKMIPILAEYEALRQHNLLEIFNVLQTRNAQVADSYVDLSALFKDASSKVIRGGLDKENGAVLGVKLKGFNGITGLEIHPGRRFGSELSDYAKVMGVKGLFHADELPKYGITQDEKDAILAALECDPEHDGFLIIADDRIIAERAILAAMDRAKDFSLRKEVRVARPDGTTSYMRPMPGAARMYPETDVKPISIDMSTITLPKLLTERIKELETKFAVSEDIAKRLIKDGVDLSELTSKYPTLKASYIIDLYYSIPKQIKKKFNLDVDMKEFAPLLLEKLNNNEITKEAVLEITVALVKGETVDYVRYKPVSLDDIKPEIERQVREMEGKPLGAIIGKVMGTYKGKVDGKALTALVKELSQK